MSRLNHGDFGSTASSLEARCHNSRRVKIAGTLRKEMIVGSV